MTEEQERLHSNVSSWVRPACWGWEIPDDETLVSKIKEKVWAEANNIYELAAELWTYRSDWWFIEVWQDGRCAICGLYKLNKDLVVDHLHSNSQARGLLCKRCNGKEGNRYNPDLTYSFYRKIHPADRLQVVTRLDNVFHINGKPLYKAKERVRREMINQEWEDISEIETEYILYYKLI